MEQGRATRQVRMDDRASPAVVGALSLLSVASIVLGGIGASTTIDIEKTCYEYEPPDDGYFKVDYPFVTNVDGVCSTVGAEIPLAAVWTTFIGAFVYCWFLVGYIRRMDLPDAAGVLLPFLWVLLAVAPLCVWYSASISTTQPNAQRDMYTVVQIASEFAIALGSIQLVVALLDQRGDSGSSFDGIDFSALIRRG